MPCHALSWPMPHGPSGCSITAEAARRFDRLKLGEVNVADRAQRLRRGAVLLIVGECLQPGGILSLRRREFGERVVPALDPAAPIGRPARADHRPAGRARGTVAGLTFGLGHGGFTNRWTGHGFHSQSLRHETWAA